MCVCVRVNVHVCVWMGVRVLFALRSREFLLTKDRYEFLFVNEVRHHYACILALRTQHVLSFHSPHTCLVFVCMEGGLIVKQNNMYAQNYDVEIWWVFKLLK